MASKNHNLLVINAGSSSIKFALYHQPAQNVLCRGSFESIGSAASFSISGELSKRFDNSAQPASNANHEHLIGWLLDLLPNYLPDHKIIAAGHRVVHGGADFAAPIPIDNEVFARLDALTPLAPGHQPHNLAAISAISRRWPDILQVACFDTAFHRTMPRTAQVFALPKELIDQGIIRYGFHGLSYQYIADTLPELIGQDAANGRVIIAHLGHGASLCAMTNRKSQATTMGFTALDGLVMGKRCGDIDPGVVLHLCTQLGMTPEQVDTLLNKNSGLLGVSGLSSDMRKLLASDDRDAQQAIDLFVYRINQKLGELTASIGGLDTLVFTAGIGTHSPVIREKICALAGWSGIEINNDANARGDLIISGKKSRVRVMVIPTDEELVIARSTAQLIPHP